MATVGDRGSNCNRRGAISCNCNNEEAIRVTSCGYRICSTQITRSIKPITPSSKSGNLSKAILFIKNKFAITKAIAIGKALRKNVFIKEFCLMVQLLVSCSPCFITASNYLGRISFHTVWLLYKKANDACLIVILLSLFTSPMMGFLIKKLSLNFSFLALGKFWFHVVFNFHFMNLIPSSFI